MRYELEIATKDRAMTGLTSAPTAAVTGQAATTPPFPTHAATERGRVPPARHRGAPRRFPIWSKPDWVKLNAPSAELQDLKDRYLAWMLSTRFAETTIRGAHTSIEWLFKFLGLRRIKRIADVTPEVLNDYSLWLRDVQTRKHEKREVSMRHIHHRLMGVKRFCEWLSGNMIVLCDPSADLELPKVPDRLPRAILSQEEVKRLLDAPDLRSPVGYRDRALLELVYATGIRTAEMFKLNVADLDFKARTALVRHGKGGKDRFCALPAITVGYLKEYVEKVRPKFTMNMKGGDDGTLFLSWKGGRLDRTRLGEIFKRNVRDARLDKAVSAMVLRHCLGSHLLENGMPLRLIQETLGHEKLETSTIYARCTLAGLRREYNKHHAREKRVRKSVDETAAGRGTI